MALYKVGFYNDIHDSTGHSHRACQRAIEVTTDRGEDAAIAHAIREFEKLELVPSWKVHAQMIECVCREPEDQE